MQAALAHPDKSPRQLAWFITDTEEAFISESSVCRILKRFDLVTSPVFQVVSASDRFKDPTRRVNELWQTDFTYFKITGFRVVLPFHRHGRLLAHGPGLEIVLKA